jgi:hypothetical protein
MQHEWDDLEMTQNVGCLTWNEDCIWGFSDLRLRSYTAFIGYQVQGVQLAQCSITLILITS